MDSCSVSVWAHLRKKTWTNDNVGMINGQLSRLTLPLQSRRGKSRTIFGAIGANVGRVRNQLQCMFVYKITGKTNSIETRDFIA